MSKYFSRFGQSKTFMVIRVNLLEAQSSGKITSPFKIDFKRGPDTMQSDNYNCLAGEVVTMNEKFEKISSFYMSSKAVFQAKTSEFRLKVNNKTLQTIPVDLSQHIGLAENQDPVSLNFDKHGLVMKVQFEIITACRVAHAHLFETMKGEEAVDTASDVTRASTASNNSSISEKEIEAFETHILKLKNENDNLRDEISEMNELRVLAEEVPDLKAQINKLEKAALGDQDLDSPFGMFSRAKISASMNYMTSLLVQKEAEIAQLKQTIKNMDNTQAKSDDEISYLINLISIQKEKIQALTAKNEKLIDKSHSEINYLMDYINEQGARIKSLEAKEEKALNELGFMYDLFTGAEKKVKSLEDKQEKALKELGFMYDLFAAAEKKVAKHESELSFVMDLYLSSHEMVTKLKEGANAEKQPSSSLAGGSDTAKFEKSMLYLVELISQKDKALNESDAEIKKLYEDIKALNSAEKTMNPEVKTNVWKTTAKKVVDAIDDYSY